MLKLVQAAKASVRWGSIPAVGDPVFGCWPLCCPAEPLVCQVPLAIAASDSPALVP